VEVSCCGLAAGAAADAVLAESAGWVGAAELSGAGWVAAAGFLTGGETGRVAALAGGVRAGATALGRLAVSVAAGAAAGVVSRDAEALPLGGIAAESEVAAAAPVVSMPVPVRERSPPHPMSRPKVNRTAA